MLLLTSHCGLWEALALAAATVMGVAASADTRTELDAVWMDDFLFGDPDDALVPGEGAITNRIWPAVESCASPSIERLKAEDFDVGAKRYRGHFKLAETWNYVDLMSLMGQIGALPAPE